MFVRGAFYLQLMEFEKLAHNAAERALDKQEGVLDEMRERTGMLLGASALATSFLGPSAFSNPDPYLAGTALIAFIVTIVACVYILLPK